MDWLSVSLMHAGFAILYPDAVQDLEILIFSTPELSLKGVTFAGVFLPSLLPKSQLEV